jgi:hypothetical protein
MRTQVTEVIYNIGHEEEKMVTDRSARLHCHRKLS